MSKAKVEAVHNEADGKPAPDPAETLEMVKIYKAAQSLRLEALALKRAANGQGDGKASANPSMSRHHGP